MTDPLTPKERAVMNALMDAWNTFTELQSSHGDHQKQFRDGIHVCQSVLMHRVVQREHPDFFPSYGTKP